MRLLLLILLWSSLGCVAQNKVDSANVINPLRENEIIQPSNRTKAIMQINALKSGALVVRLKTNDKSIDAYRNSGRNDIADRMEAERLVQNQKIATAFKTNFDFCPVYFMYSRNTNALLRGEQGLFLNDTLGIDTSIHLKQNFFLFAEYGTVTSNQPGDSYHYSGVNKTEPSTNTMSTSTIFMSDTSLQQLAEPFPFYQVVYLENYAKAIDKLNRALYKFFYGAGSTLQEEKKKHKQ